MAIKLAVRKFSRRELRYRLFRIQNDIPVDPEDGLQEYFESQEEFDGWHNFTKTWDVKKEDKWPKGHWEAQPLRKSAEASWNAKLLTLAEDFPFEQPEEPNNEESED